MVSPRISTALFSIATLQLLTILAGVLRAKGLALALGPGDFGVVGAIDQAVFAAVTFGALAMPYTAMKFMARSHSEGDAEFRRTGAGFLRLLMALALVTAPLVYAVCTLSPGLLGADLAPYNTQLRIAVLAVPSGILVQFFVNAFAAAQRPGTGTGVNLLYVAAVSAAAVGGAYAYGISGIYVASVAAAIAVMVGGLVHLNRALGIRVTASHTGIVQQLRAQPEIIGYAACFYATLLGYALTLLIARTVAIGVLGTEPAGLLQAMFSISLALGAVLTSLNNLYLAPLVNRRTAAAEKVAATGDFSSRILVILLLSTLPIVLFPGFFLRTLFSADFVPAAGVLWWFVLWQCISLIGNAYQQLLIGLDDVVYIAVAAILSHGATIAALAPLSEALGIGGIGLALCGGAVLHFGMLALRVLVRHGGRVPSLVLVRMAGVAAIVVGSHLVFAQRHEVGVGAIADRLLFAAGAVFLAWLTLDRADRDPRAMIAALRGAARSATSP